jgi:DNA repair exonuclease SbcCD ATPase subunit
VISVLQLAASGDQAARKRLSGKLAERAGYTLAAQYLPVREEYCEEVIGELSCHRDEKKRRVELLAQHIQLLDEANREITRLGALRTSLQLSIDERNSCLQQVETEQLINLRQEIADNELLQREVSARNKQWGELRAQVKQLEESYKTANAAFYEIEDRMKKDEQKRVLITDLIKLRDLLSNDGLPLVYARFQFEKLAELTQINLVKINAAFAIEVDRSRDLSFTFKRLDKDDGIELPMSSLSGGQRVRLCVAFLIAVQKQLVPDVGMLVLDEPTTSVDEAGRLEIAEFIAGLNKELQNTEMQVWICDHSVEVKDRIDCKIELN